MTEGVPRLEELAGGSEQSLDFLIGKVSIPAIQNLQEVCVRASADRGWHEETLDLQHEREADEDNSERNLNNFYGNKMMLIVGEVVEAHEKLREGRGMDETFYPSKPSETNLGGDLSYSAVVKGIYKPEGIPSELADVVIRTFDLAGAAGIDLAAMIVEKLRYNATRPHKHGGKKF